MLGVPMVKTTLEMRLSEFILLYSRPRCLVNFLLRKEGTVFLVLQEKRSSFSLLPLKDMLFYLASDLKVTQPLLGRSFSFGGCINFLC